MRTSTISEQRAIRHFEKKKNQILLRDHQGFNVILERDNISNLLLMNLFFKCPITTLFTLFSQTFFSTSKGPCFQHFHKFEKHLCVQILSVFHQNYNLDCQLFFIISLLQQCKSQQIMMPHIHLNENSYSLNDS